MWESLRDRVLEKVARATPGPIAAAIDQLRPALAQGFGGPFNGQERRVEAVRDMFAQVHFESIVETGTYRATTTLYFRRLAEAPIATVEANSRYYHYAQRRLRGVPNVTLIRGDSAEVLGSLATESPWNRGPTFFYLDAHWLGTLPLLGELEAIGTGWRDYAVLIDDFRVPGDPGYACDDYGPGKVLESAILAPLTGKPVAVYWPAAHSRAETGARRGWVVLATAGSVDDSFRSLETLRRAGSVDSVIGATGGTEVP